MSLLTALILSLSCSKTFYITSVNSFMSIGLEMFSLYLTSLSLCLTHTWPHTHPYTHTQPCIFLRWGRSMYTLFCVVLIVFQFCTHWSPALFNDHLLLCCETILGWYWWPWTGCLYPSKFVCWKLTPKMMVLGGGDLWKMIRSWGFCLWGTYRVLCKRDLPFHYGHQRAR